MGGGGGGDSGGGSGSGGGGSVNSVAAGGGDPGGGFHNISNLGLGKLLQIKSQGGKHKKKKLHTTSLQEKGFNK